MRALLPAVLLIALALAGCSSADDQEADDDGAMPGDGMTSGNMTAPMDAAPMTHTVMLQNNEFAPTELTIHVGDTVTWHTMDPQAHNVVSNSPGQEFRSADISSIAIPTVRSDTYSRTFSTVGHVDYLCEYHSGMVATLEVVPANQTIANGGM
jgi:plastocyanin